jgi:hypothetical protein
MHLKRRSVMQALWLGLLVTLVVFALCACSGAGAGGGGEEQPKAKEEAEGRPLPKDPQALSPGQYHSVKFKPSLSFKVSKGWINSGVELPAFIQLGYEGFNQRLTFANVKEVYKPGTTNVVGAPKDLVGWLQRHPLLKTSKPQPVTVGGVKGEQFDVLVEDLPKDYSGLSCSDCVDIAPLSNDQAAAFFREEKTRKVIVLEDVKGDTVMIWFAATPDEFDEFAPEAQKVVESVKWSSS